MSVVLIAHGLFSAVLRSGSDSLVTPHSCSLSEPIQLKGFPSWTPVESCWCSKERVFTTETYYLDLLCEAKHPLIDGSVTFLYGLGNCFDPSEAIFSL